MGGSAASTQVAESPRRVTIMQANYLAFRILGVGVALECRAGVCAIGVVDPARNIIVPVASGASWEAAMEALLRDQAGATRRFRALRHELVTSPTRGTR